MIQVTVTSTIKLPHDSNYKIIDRTTRHRRGLSWHLRRALSWIPEGDLFGVEKIVLTEQLGPATRTSPDWHKELEGRELAVGGLYYGRREELRPTIVVHVASLYRGIPKSYWFSPVITLKLTHILAHEVGHHLIGQRGYIFEIGERTKPSEYEEELANRYSFSVRKRMLRRWYYRFGDWLARDLAGWHYALGICDWRDGEYEKAAARWEFAFALDPNRNDAAYWYHRAKEAAIEDTKHK